MLGLTVGHPGAHRLPAPVTSPRPRRVRGIRAPGWCAAARGGCATGSATTSRATRTCCWAGTAPEYTEQLKAFYRAVKDADPAAAVVLGGCGYDVFSSEPGSAPRQFFDHLAGAGRDAFDLFSVHLYGDPASVPHYLDTARQFMRARGYLKPVIVGEHAGPQPFEFPVRHGGHAAGCSPPRSPRRRRRRAPASWRRRRARTPPNGGPCPPSTPRWTTSRPRCRCSSAGCPAELEAKRNRISCRQLVMRTLLALADGVHRTAYWNLAPEYPGPVNDPPDDVPADRQAPTAGIRGATASTTATPLPTPSPSSPGSSPAHVR